MLRVYSKTHPTGMWQASLSWKSWEAKACKGQHRKIPQLGGPSRSCWNFLVGLKQPTQKQ